MAELEMIMGIRSTYYFRTKHSSFNPNIIKSILNLGHDIGYHYECLSDTNGIDDLAIVDFEKNLTQLRKICPIHTIAMHGSPLKPYNNSEIWRNPQNRSQLKNKYNIIGDLYIDIDYSDIAYITDTGRNWLSSKYNIRDKVDSHVKTDFLNGRKLYDFLRNNPHPKLIFQVHPERWSPNDIDFILQLCIDKGTNFLKLLINAVK
ncbi:MAG TPA: hypothetical protein HA348_06755 [Thermoplasmata archaeon]|nr:hypothetical protein [Thermoplasmata archaeon]